MKTFRDGAMKRTTALASSAKRTGALYCVAVILTILALTGKFSPNAFAQTQSGLSTIQGTVTDSSGAVIRGATIHIVNNATGAATDTKSNDVGFYQVPGLVTGNYNISVQASAMKTYVYALHLLATQTAVVNPVLAPGAVTEQVSVSANMVQLTDPTSGAITSTLDNDQINHIPMNGRQISILVQYTTPGLETGFGGGGTRMNGLVNEAMVYTEDGAPTQDRNFGGFNGANQSAFADADSIQEVRVEASGSSAQYGFPATAIITTKSGTNQIHGSAFYTGRNNTIAGVAAGRGNSRPFNPPNLKRDEFGISAGGPVIIPGLYNGKEKTFWFLGWEKFDYIYSTLQTAATETEAMKGGDFSGLSQLLYDPLTTHNDPACPTPGLVNGLYVWNAGPTVANPYCRTPFGNGKQYDPGNNQIPVSRRNKLAKIIYDGQIPANVPGITNPRAQANENWNAPNFEHVPSITWRLDHNFSPNDRAYLRYSSNMQTWQYYGGSLGTIAADGIPALTFGTETIAPATNFVAALGYSHVFSPTFFSETILSGQWFRDIGGNTGDQHHNYEADLGVPNNWGDTGMPAFNGSIQGHNGGQFGYGIGQTTRTISENLTKTLSKHQLLFGGQYLFEKLHYQPDISGDSEAADAAPTALYNPGTGTSYGGFGSTGDSAGAFFLGSLATMSTNLNERVVPMGDQVAALYIQDNYHIKRNLTLNIGLRWENHPAMDSGGVGVGTDLPHHAIVLERPISEYIASGRTTQSIITAYQNAGAVYETPAEAGFPSKMLRSYPLIFDPHLGFSWQPLGTRLGTILSGSYGVYSFPEAMRNLLGLARSAPFIGGFSYNNNNAGQNPDGVPNYEIRNPQNIFMGVNTPNTIVPVTGTNFVLPGSIGGGYNPNFPPTRVQELNVNIEQPFKDQSALRITYNYTRTSNLTHNFNINGGLSPFVYAFDYGVTPPTGGASTYGTCQYQNTGLQPYDCKWFGGFGINNRDGWSNYNALQVNYQRTFHRGFAYQATYVWSKQMRIGGNSTRESIDYSYAHYPGALGSAAGIAFSSATPTGTFTAPLTPPPPPPGAELWTSYKALNRFQDYKVEPYFSQPFHHIWINGIYELPFGHGKWLLSNSNRLVDEIVGGWEIAGVGQILSTSFSPGSSHWGKNNPIKLYKHNQKPITDCSSGKCVSRYLWFNGYISPKNLTAANGGVCDPNAASGNKCITGLPSDYVPYQVPINNDPSCGALCNANFGTDNVTMTGPNLNGGKPWTVGFAPDSSQGYAGNNAYSRTYLSGPFEYNADLSVFKVFPIREKVNFRVNLDAFNAFNIQGYALPNGTSGEEIYMPGGVDGNGSYWTPRQLQLTMRFSW